MAQDEQEPLIEWLGKNNLNFMKDALVEEGYTLKMIIEMTDKDIEDIIDGLDMPKIKRPRFRNAVKRLKQKPQPQAQQAQQQPQKQKKSPMSKSEKKSKNLILSTSPNTKAITFPQGQEETFESLLSINDSQRIKNGYVIISAIEDYSQSKPNGKWPNLDGTKLMFKI